MTLNLQEQMGERGLGTRDLLWYAKRARVMSPGEVLHRLMDQCRLFILRGAYEVGWTPRYGNGQAHPRDPENFGFCAAATPQLPTLAWTADLDDRACTALLEGRVHVLGASWTWKDDQRVWHEAPDTGRSWPRIFFGAIRHRPGNPFGDARVVWEPARLQHLVALSLLARERTPEMRGRAVHLIEQQILSWVEANPVLTGIHYVSAMECALRILAVCHALDVVRDWLTEPQEVWRAVLSLMESHADLVSRRLSMHSSRGNHTVAEATGLFYVGTLFPEFPQARGWVKHALRLLEDSSAHLVQGDGGGGEQSLWYHWLIMDLYGLIDHLARHRAIEVPAGLTEARERATAFLNEFAPSAARLPRIGDGDQGYALSPFLRISSQPSHRASGLRTFQPSGYSIIRTNEEPPATLVFDHGPLGLPPCHGHGHADALSVILRIEDREVLVDPGTYSYGGDPRWRAYFRGTGAHNTVSVDGLDQAVQEGPFLWSQPYNTTLHRQVVEADGAVALLASHDGYQSRAGVVHWRGVRYQPPGRWVIWDCLTGAGEHDLELHWHVAGSVAVQQERYTVELAGRGLAIQVQGGIASAHKGELQPIRGWQAPTYGVLEPITTLRVACRTHLPHEFVTTLCLIDGLEDGRVSGTFWERVPDTVLSSFRRWVHETEAH